MLDTAPPPQWIAEMYAGKVGRDHLGLGSVSSDQILTRLSPGINVLTVHPRYYSFYTFLLDEYWRRELPRTRAAWARFYRPREFVFSIGAHLCQQPEHGDLGNIIGAQKTYGLAGQRREVYDTTFNYIKSDLGGYGLYYRSVIAELGLIYPGGPGFPYPVDVPSERGKVVAEAFRSAVETTSYYEEHFALDATEVPIEVINKYISKACLCQLQTESAPDRDIVRDIFLHAVDEASSLPRRETFRLFLDLADQTDGYAITQDHFRQLLFFGETEDGAAYEPSPSVESTYKKWRLYQAREYYAFSLNALWCHLCDWGVSNGGDSRPVPIEDFWAHLRQALDFDALAEWLEAEPPQFDVDASFDELLEWMNVVNELEPGERFDDVAGSNSLLNEHDLYRGARNNRTDPTLMVGGAVSILGLIHLRFSEPELWLEPEWTISRLGGEDRLSLHGFLRELRDRLQSHPSILEVLRWVFEDYVITQHLLVASSKLPENTFRFQREGARLRFFVLENALGFNDSRFEAISTSLHELGLCGHLTREEHPLTEEGRVLLDTGDLA
jgi:hypothetical protein